MLANAMAVIEGEYFKRELALEPLAERLQVSARQLQRAFREEGDTTFRAYLDQVRMERAAQLLIEEAPARPVPVRSTDEVAAMVGYSHRSGFAKAFRRYWGEPPSAMR